MGIEYMVKVGAYPGNEIRLTSIRNCYPGGPRSQSGEPAIVESGGEPGGQDTPTLTVARNSSPPSKHKPGYGSLPPFRRFSNYARNRIQRAGACLDDHVKTGSLVFLTLTLPGSTRDAMEGIAKWSAWLILELKKWIFKREKSALSLYCWEWQKRGALHLHYAVVLHNQNARKFVIENIRRWWHDALERVSKKEGVDMFARQCGGSWKGHYDKIQCDAQVVVKSVARYLSKYLSKAIVGDKVRHLPCPSRWFGVSRTLSEIVTERTMECIRRFTDRGRFERLLVRVNSCFDSAEGLRWGYLDKSGLAEVRVIYPASTREYELLIKEMKEMIEASATNAVSPAKNRYEMRAYWTALRNQIPGFEGFVSRSNPARYAYLKRLATQDGLPSLDFIVLGRWLMYCLGHYDGTDGYDRVRRADDRMNEYLVRVIGVAGRPEDSWNLLPTELRQANFGSVPMRKTIVLPQWR